jgi:hypothetical protein
MRESERVEILRKRLAEQAFLLMAVVMAATGVLAVMEAA